MYRTKITHWPTRNPFGDSVFYKPLLVNGGSFRMNEGSSATFSEPFQINSGLDLLNWVGQVQGVPYLCAAFYRYRIAGMKVSITFWPLAPNDLPLVGFIHALPTETFILPSINETTEQRWCKYRVLNFPGQGAKPTKLSMYLPVKKIFGVDRIVPNDADFVGSCFPVSPYFDAPVQGPFWRYGVMTLNGAVLPVGNGPADCHYKLEVKPYFKFFAKRVIS